MIADYIMSHSDMRVHLSVLGVSVRVDKSTTTPAIIYLNMPDNDTVPVV